MHMHDTFLKLCPTRTTSMSLARKIAEILGAVKIVGRRFCRVKTALFAVLIKTIASNYCFAGIASRVFASGFFPSGAFIVVGCINDNGSGPMSLSHSP